MRALTVAPGIAFSARVDDVPEPLHSDGAVLVRTLALGVCGTDREIASGAYGWAPPGAKRRIGRGRRRVGPLCILEVLWLLCNVLSTDFAFPSLAVRL